jgi:hypothetical protein
MVNDLKCSAKDRRDECGKNKKAMPVSFASEDGVSSANRDLSCSLNQAFCDARETTYVSVSNKATGIVEHTLFPIGFT